MEWWRVVVIGWVTDILGELKPAGLFGEWHVESEGNSGFRGSPFLVFGPGPGWMKVPFMDVKNQIWGE